MGKNFKFFTIALFISLPFWLGVNVFAEKLESFFYWQDINQNPQFFTAQLNLEKKLERMKPLRERNVEDLDLNVKSAISILIKSDGTSKIIFEKDGNRKLPIASITKLVTALVVLENYDLSKIIEISPETAQIDKEYGYGKLKIAEKFSAKDLLYILLMESSNGAAQSLASVIGEKEFVDLMNITSARLEMENTFFVNPTGLDPDNPSDLTNYSTAEDLIKLAKYLLEKQPLIWEIAGNLEFNLYLSDGETYQQLKNTNELLKEIPQVGGKTGWTPQAGGCLLLVYKSPNKNGYLINVILGSENRFEDMKKLINWSKKAYKWQ
jgi:D-alanyl-D-alanine carboxypeptidase